MADETTIVTAMQGLPWVKAIISDGRWEDSPKKGDRTLISTPYIEMQLEADYGNDSSDGKMRSARMQCRIVFNRYQGSANKYRRDLEALLCDQKYNLVDFSIGLPFLFSGRLDQLPFTMTYWRVVEKAVLP